MLRNNLLDLHAEALRSGVGSTVGSWDNQDGEPDSRKRFRVEAAYSQAPRGEYLTGQDEAEVHLDARDPTVISRGPGGPLGWGDSWRDVHQDDSGANNVTRAVQTDAIKVDAAVGTDKLLEPTPLPKQLGSAELQNHATQTEMGSSSQASDNTVPQHVPQNQFTWDPAPAADEDMPQFNWRELVGTSTMRSRSPPNRGPETEAESDLNYRLDRELRRAKAFLEADREARGVQSVHTNTHVRSACVESPELELTTDRDSQNLAGARVSEATADRTKKLSESRPIRAFADFKDADLRDDNTDYQHRHHRDTNKVDTPRDVAMTPAKVFLM